MHTLKSRLLAGAMTVVLLAGCAPLRRPLCAPGEQVSVNELLYFGTARPGGAVVSADEWAAFVARTVTPRFPKGFTTWRAQGQWQSADGTPVREDSFVLNVVHPAGDAADRAIQAIVTDYKARFAQEAVLRVRARACVSF